MKQMLLALAMVAPLMAQADSERLIIRDHGVRAQAIHQAQELRQELVSLGQQADEVSDRAAAKGNLLEE